MKFDNIDTRNSDRFTNFSNTYDNARPIMPYKCVEIAKMYLNTAPEIVIDLGCGTGLSTMVWRNDCKKAIGIEPSDDMRSIAIAKQVDNISFIKGFSTNTTLQNNFADCVLCSQSFHWMEPITSLKEINRILKDGGIFMTIDCDWPPLFNLVIEKAYTKLFEKVRFIEDTNPLVKDTFVRYSKDKHLENIKNSGYFNFSREIVFSNTEKCDVSRLINMCLSQGSLQSILKVKKELINDDLEEYISLVKDICSEDKFDIEFCYRMRIGIK